MEKISIKIGGHFMKVIGTSNEIINMFKRTYTPFICPTQLNYELTISLEGGYGVSFVDHEVSIIEEPNKILFARADYLIEVDPEYKHAKLYVHDELALKHALMNLYSSFIVHNNWGLLIHSSCVVENRNAHIFSGHSGAGKSTAAKLSLPRELLSDEATIIKITDDGVTVFDSPFRSELSSKGEVDVYPLQSIQLLHQSLSNKRVELKKSAALMQLIDKVFYWSYKPEQISEIFNLLKLLVDNVPTHQLYFQKNNTFWELIS